MKKIILTLCLSSSILISGCQTTENGNMDWMSIGQTILNSNPFQAGTSLAPSEISEGLKEALTVGTGIVVTQLGTDGGFNLDPAIHIPLPSSLQKIDDTLSKVGLGSLTSDLKNRMNRAAEIVTPRAKELFVNAITNMTITDAKNILMGSDNAATSYLRQSMGSELATDIGPIVQDALNTSGAVQAYDSVMARYKNIPFMPDIKSDLNNYVVEKSLDGIFYYVAKEEAEIRNNPVKRTTDILQKVFGK